jgi:EmrB/QacA subfamily drug resistance transporter
VTYTERPAPPSIRPTVSPPSLPSLPGASLPDGSLPGASLPDASLPFRWGPLVVLLIGVAMVVLDFFIVNVALADIQTHLHAGSGAIEWVVAGYGLTSAVFLISAGRVGDRIGRRRVFVAGLAGFVLASAACGLAPDTGVLVAARLAQGAAGALIGTSVLAIITAAYEGPQRARALGVYGTVMGLAAACGQLVGGALVQVNVFGLGWRAIFLVNVPIGAVGLALAPRLIPESRASVAARLDLVGMGLSVAGLTAIVFPLIEGRQYGWPAWTWVSLGAGLAVVGVLAVHQRWLAQRGGAALFPPAVFADTALVRGLVTQAALWAGQASFFLVFALYLQEGRGLDPLDAGLVFTVLAASYLLVSLRAPALSLRFGRDVVTFGAATLVVGYGVLVAGTAIAGRHASLVALFPGLLLVGAGMALCLAPLATTVLMSVHPERAGMASGLMSTMQQVGNSIGVAVVSVVFFDNVSGGYPHAFELASVTLAALLAVVALLTRSLPRRPAR